MSVKAMKKKNSVVYQNGFDNFTKAQRIVAFNMPLLQVAVYTCMLLLSWLGAELIVDKGNLTTGELVSMFNYTMQILMSLMMMSMTFVQLMIARTSAERITEVLTEESDLKNGDNPLTEVSDGSVEFNDVCFSYKDDMDKLVLENIDLKIASGEVIGIVGGTGSSKSSLVQLIPRLYDVTHGQIKVGGHDVRSYDLETLRDQVGMVLQNNVLFSGTITENLRWGDENATEEEVIHAATIAQADSFIQEFPNKYDTMISEGGNNVSGGQKQRLTIARALLKKPKILILDDSTSAVDTKTDRAIREGLAKEIPGRRPSLFLNGSVPSKMQIGSSYWTMEKSTVLERMMSCWQIMLSIKKSLILNRKDLVTMMNKATMPKSSPMKTIKRLLKIMAKEHKMQLIIVFS